MVTKTWSILCIVLVVRLLIPNESNILGAYTSAFELGFNWGINMHHLANTVGIKMKVHINYNGKALKSILVTIVLVLSLAFFATSFSVAQETSTLTPVQTETNLTAQEATTQTNNTEDVVVDINPQDSAIITTTIVTTPEIEVKADNPESRVCDVLANQIINNLEQYPDWQISLNDSNGNVQGLGTMTPSGLELELFNPNARELYLYYFTDEKAITIANSSGLRISLIQRDNTQGASSTYATDSNGRGIIINAVIGEDREARPINDCILPFEDVFQNYSIKGN